MLVRFRNGTKSVIDTCFVVVIFVIDRSSQNRSVSVFLGTLTGVFAWFTTRAVTSFEACVVCCIELPIFSQVRST